jgi:hypothetical protein
LARSAEDLLRRRRCEVQIDLSRAVWCTSTFSNGSGGNCVEVATKLASVVAVRDSKDRQGPTLAVSGRAWTAFTDAVKDGEVDL